VAEIDWNKVYAGLPPHDWHELKDRVLAASRGEWTTAIPLHLLEHEAARHLLLFYQNRDSSALNKAAKALCPQCPEQAWLVLEKS
jgi:hypothetical protein